MISTEQLESLARVLMYFGGMVAGLLLGYYLWHWVPIYLRGDDAR